jgi:hypothetical protein
MNVEVLGVATLTRWQQAAQAPTSTQPSSAGAPERAGSPSASAATFDRVPVGRAELRETRGLLRFRDTLEAYIQFTVAHGPQPRLDADASLSPETEDSVFLAHVTAGRHEG